MDDQETHIDTATINEVIALAKEREMPVAAMSMEDLAKALGISRMTLYRRIGSRQALHDAVLARGIDPGEQPGARERAILAAAEIIREGGIAGLTLDEVAARADCALPTIHTRFQGRSGLLAAVFERHVPMLAVREVLGPVAPGDRDGLRAMVREAYRVILDAVDADRGLFRAVLAEALRDPSGETDAFFTTRYVPHVAGHIFPWLAEQMMQGTLREVPLVLALQQFLSPILLHAATRPLVEAIPVLDLPSRDATCDSFAAMFCRALAPES